MLYRKAKESIENWLNEEKKALLVTGARQVGKTYLITNLLEEKKLDFVSVNLIKSPDAISIFESMASDGLDMFIKKLSMYLNKPIKPGCIIFIDEVQKIKDTITMIKFLAEENKYKFIMSGSLLGVELKNLRSAPVGYLDTITMHPMDFEEFAIALGLDKEIFNYLKECFNDKKEVDELINKKMLDTFHTYLVVGGMPEAVNDYLINNDFSRVRKIHEQIVLQYKEDFTKYEVEQKLKLTKMYDLIPSELNSKNRRFIFTDVDKNFIFNRYENSFNWLIDSGVSIPTYNVTEVMVPLEINKKSNLFKLFLSDIGLLTSIYGTTTQLKILNNESDINYGAPYENVIAEELKSHGFKTYFYNSKKYGEVDFVIEYKNEVLPIEVKSGKTYTNHNALNNLLNIKELGIKNAYVLCNSNVTVKDKITYLPIYMIMFIVNNDDYVTHEKIDLSTLSIDRNK